MSECPRKFIGKFRGSVVNNEDPKKIGRIQALVPEVSNLMLSNWAMPCFLVGGMQTGVFSIPQIGAGVWIEFEQGDLNYPIWTGFFYGTAAEIPTLAQMVLPGVSGITLQTTAQNGIVISDMQGPMGGIMLMSSNGAKIIVNDTGIYIDNGKGATIEMKGTSVLINNDALVVLK